MSEKSNIGRGKGTTGSLGSGGAGKSGTSGKRPQATIEGEAKEIKTESSTKSVGSSSDDVSKERPKTKPNLKSAKDVQTGQSVKDDKKDKPASASAAPGGKSPRPAESSSGGVGQALGHFASGVIGGFVALFLAAYGLNWTGTGGPLAEGEMKKFEERMAAVEKSMGDAGPEDLKTLKGQVEKAETSLAEVRKAIAALRARADKIDTAMVSSAEDGSNGNASVGSAVAVAPLIARIEAVEKSLSSVEGSDTDGGVGSEVGIAALEKQLDEKIETLRSSLTAMVASRPASGAGSGASNARLTAVREELNLETERMRRSLTEMREQAGRTENDLVSVKSRTQLVSEDVKALRDGAAHLTSTVSELKNELSLIKEETTRVEGIAKSFQPLPKRIASLEDSVSGVLSRESSAQVDARKTALAVAIANLKRVIDRGEAYENELGVVEKLGPQGLNLAALKPYSSVGVVPASKLERSFASTARGVLDADAAPDDGSIVSSLIANARSVVRVRRTGNVKGDSAEAVIARMELRVKEGNLGAALNEGQGLSGLAKEAAEPWLSKVSARIGVDNAMEQVETDLISALGGGSAAVEGK